MSSQQLYFKFFSHISAHTITFVPPILIVNLLPCYLRFQLKGSEAQAENIEPGKESCLSVSGPIPRFSVQMHLAEDAIHK